MRSGVHTVMPRWSTRKTVPETTAPVTGSPSLSKIWSPSRSSDVFSQANVYSHSPLSVATGSAGRRTIQQGGAGMRGGVWPARCKQCLVPVDLPAVLSLRQAAIGLPRFELEQDAAALVLQQEVQPALEPHLGRE